MFESIKIVSTLGWVQGFVSKSWTSVRPFLVLFGYEAEHA